MIPVEELRAVRTIVTHRYADGVCSDGMASASIIKDVLPEARVVFLSHGTREFEEFPSEPGQLFVDLSPPEPRAGEFAGKGAIVLDHHKTARRLERLFGHRFVYADNEGEDPGVSGALLAFRHVWLPLASPEQRIYDESLQRFATLVGIRDTWRRDSANWDEACALSAALTFYPEASWYWPVGCTRLEHGYGVYRPRAVSVMEERVRVGELLVGRARAKAEDVARGAAVFVTEKGTRVAAVNELVGISDVADLLTAGGSIDVVAGFGYNSDGSEQALKISLRSRGEADVSRLAKLHGGGGHRGAAGLTLRSGLSVLFQRSPYEVIAGLAWKEAGL